MAFSHSDNSLLAKWWHNVDRKLLIYVIALTIIGFLMTMIAGPYSARRVGLSDYHFLTRFLVFLIPGSITLIGISMTKPEWLKKFTYSGVLISLFLLIAVLFVGSVSKGASRWFDFGIMKLQPSEIFKPFFIIFTAIILTKIKALMTDKKKNKNKILYLAIILFSVFFTSIICCLLQPDNGMTFTIITIFVAQLFLFGIPYRYVFIILGMMIGLSTMLYFTSNHFQDRIHKFISPEKTDNYQVKKALSAIKNGGLLPLSIGKGYIKQNIPDSHTDFVLAVFTEEFGLLFTLLLVGFYFYIILETLFKLRNQKSTFIALAGGGLILLFGFQAIINIASTFNIIPTKGMTLPFISYGGSSFLSFCIVFGFLLNFFNKSNNPERYTI
ncbi:MAG: FtsW/RodA/SpoVE family cell cycle protein [Rickettsiales bacterium]|jgi:cell division protein FtsW|nr:FtsW/RodA/SpoVE family cell cycle protein [Rickettsiales bacterium]